MKILTRMGSKPLDPNEALELAVVEHFRDSRASKKLVAKYELHEANLSSGVETAEDFSPEGSKLEKVMFLYEQRMALFNERRGHEWRALFATWGFLGAGDAAFLNLTITIDWPLAAGWSVICLIMTISVLLYQRDLQRFVRTDRLAMDYLYNAICDHLKMPKLYPGRERLPQRPRPRLGWAHRWQVALLGALAVLSGVLPWLLR